MIKFKALDYKLSPYTGLTRDSWIEAGKYLLEGVFRNVPNMDTPIVVERFETEITYPHKNISKEKLDIQEKAERLEGLARSFFVAAPLIHDNPQIEINGIKLSEYYKKHILKVCDKDDCLYAGDFEYMIKAGIKKDRLPKFQQTVECSALVIGLWMTKNEIWNMYNKSEQDIIANYLFSFAYGNTHNDNWNMFNALCLAFLSSVGYTVDKERMMHHIYSALSYYSGDGWYRDGHIFDYYSSWAFNLYGPIWNLMYGYENAPDAAKKFEKNSNELMKTYCDFFDKDGFTNMWGRSIIYRNASTSAFVGNAFLANSKMDYGLARRIMSGSLKQFLCRDDFLKNGVPSLGFYGQFRHLLQGYSCAASPLWCTKPFLALYLPKEHLLWSSVENNGSWEKLGGEVKETVLDGPALCYTNHGANGETILRTAKVSTDVSDTEGMWNNYFKLMYNSKYPWEATPCDREEIQSQQYIIRDMENDTIQRGNQIWWAGSHDGVLYRKQMFGYILESRMERMQQIYLADFPVDYGILRVDKINLCDWPVEIILSGYGFCDNEAKITHKTNGNASAIILKGKDYAGQEKQLAMTIYDGWDKIDYVNSIGTNPDSEKSIIVYAKTKRDKAYDGTLKKVLISQVITKESHKDFTDEEIFPIKSIDYSDEYNTGIFGDIKIILKNRKMYTVNFDEIDGRLSL